LGYFLLLKFFLQVAVLAPDHAVNTGIRNVVRSDRRNKLTPSHCGFISRFAVQNSHLAKFAALDFLLSKG
jgi:hypothetical protein